MMSHLMDQNTKGPIIGSDDDQWLTRVGGKKSTWIPTTSVSLPVMFNLVDWPGFGVTMATPPWISTVNGVAPSCGLGS